jgi:hypothetical protein
LGSGVGEGVGCCARTLGASREIISSPTAKVRRNIMIGIS